MATTAILHQGYLTSNLSEIDPEIFNLICRESDRQRSMIGLIAAENMVSKAVLETLGSILTNKTLEGYSGKRYHGGGDTADRIEELAIERACKLFGAPYANVQPHSGSQANHAAIIAMTKPGDRIMSMSLNAGGHLSHGAKANFTATCFDVVQYGVRRSDGLIDYDDLEKLALMNRPKLIIAGGSSYPRTLDFAALRQISDLVGAYLLVDMAHFAGLVAGGVYPNPINYADVVTTTSYKSLRGARGGLILSSSRHLAKRIDRAVFPQLQGTPHLSLIAAKAVCLKEALRPEFSNYATTVLENARVLADTLKYRGYDLVGGGTDTAMVLVDLRSKGLRGDDAQHALERAGLVCNKNIVPDDPRSPNVTSGIRLGSALGTTIGFRKQHFHEIANLIGDVLDELAASPDNRKVESLVRTRVDILLAGLPEGSLLEGNGRNWSQIAYKAAASPF